MLVGISGFRITKESKSVRGATLNSLQSHIGCGPEWILKRFPKRRKMPYKPDYQPLLTSVCYLPVLHILFSV